MEKIFYAGAVVVTNRSGVKINKATERKEAMWRRLQNKINKRRNYLSQSSKDKEVCNVRHWETLDKNAALE